MCEGPVDPLRLNPAASDAHPADDVIFTALASSHPAVLHSSRLNELTLPVAGGSVRAVQQRFLLILQMID